MSVPGAAVCRQDREENMITILGATGNVGSKIAELLSKKGEKVRLIARSVDRLRQRVGKKTEAMAGDAMDTEFLVKAFMGSDALFTMIPPNGKAENFLDYADKIGASIARAVEIARLDYVVNLSSIGAELSSGTGPIVGLHNQEERLNKIPGLNVLHIRAGYFMENLLMNLDMIRTQGMNGGPIRGDLKMPMIATADIALFAAERLQKRDFSGSTVAYLLGRRGVGFTEATMAIGIRAGKPNLRYNQFSYEEAQKSLVAAGLSADMSSLYTEMAKAFNEGRITAKRTPENTTGTSLEEFCDHVLIPVFMRKKAA
jgi:uncharacterized protein YbjT (DUF2867 family)